MYLYMNRKQFEELKEFNKEDFTSIKINRKIIQGKFNITKRDKIKICILTVISMIMIVILFRISKEVNRIKGEYDLKQKECESNINEINDIKAEMRSTQGQMRSLNDCLSSVQQLIKSRQNKKKDLLYQQNVFQSRLSSSSINIKETRQAKIYLLNEITVNKIKYNSLLSKSESLHKEYNSLTKSESSFLTQSQIKQIEDWNKITFITQCYSSNYNDLDPKLFHKKCDKVGSTVTIVLTDYNEIVGGYTRVSWGSKESKADYLSTIFNLNMNSIFHLHPFVVGILPDPGRFPYFGHDLYFRENGTGFSQFPYVYGDPDNKISDFIINPQFNIKKIEVYQVKEL